VNLLFYPFLMKDWLGAIPQDFLPRASAAILKKLEDRRARPEFVEWAPRLRSTLFHMT
jgi:hypothetical protein